MHLRAQNKAAQAEYAACSKRKKQDRMDASSFWEEEAPPTTLPPPEDTENLQTLRARVPPRSVIVDEKSVFLPPMPTETLEEACRAAAKCVQYDIHVAMTEDYHELVAAGAVRAIAAAVSTCPTLPVFVSAVTMAESIALIASENPYRSRYYTRLPPGVRARRQLNALNAAVEAGMAADAKDRALAKDTARPPDCDNIHHPDS
jgi:hypothetical protein